VTGIDGCRGGWVAVTLTTAGTRVTMARTLGELGLDSSDGITGIDMPLGLLGEGWRTADLLARRALGRRGSCVFAIPPRPVWNAPDYPAANRLCRELTGGGMSAQAWGLRAKLLEADLFRRSPTPPTLYEVHPELSFAVLAGAPLSATKHSEAGLAIRRALLREAGIALPARVPGAAIDDVLDAAAVAWSARRIAAGTAIALTDAAQRADDGEEIAIRY
jgi:predicted RNase H-like nuclease